MAIKPGVKGWNPKTPAALPGKNISGKVNIQPAQFDKLVDAQGVRVKVYRTSYCPNVKSIDGAEHEVDCALCHGSGFLDRYCLETWALLQNQDSNRSIFPEGNYDGNTVMATFMQGVELQYFTLVELLDFSEAFFERIKRQEGPLDVLRYPGVRVNMVVDKAGKEYFEGSDFNLDANGNILWSANKGPTRGMIYTINYETKIRFRAIRAVHSNRFVQVAEAGQTKLVKMNECWMLQKEYLVVRKDLDGNVIAPNKIRDSDEAEEDDGY
jgi:hypothetical protein